MSFSPDWILFTSTTESNFPLSHHRATQTLDKSFHEWMNWNESTTLIHLAVLCFRFIYSYVPFIFMWITLFLFSSVCISRTSHNSRHNGVCAFLLYMRFCTSLESWVTEKVLRFNIYKTMYAILLFNVSINLNSSAFSNINVWDICCFES